MRTQRRLHTQKWIATTFLLIILFGLASIAFSTRKNVAAPIERALLYTVGQPVQLRIRQFGDNVVLASEVNANHFTISKNCRRVIATGTEGPLAYMRVMDLDREKVDQVYFSDIFFNDPEVYMFANPTFAPDHQSFAVVGLKPGSRSTIYWSDGGSATAVAHLVDLRVIDIRWINPESFILESTNGPNKPFIYLRVDSDGQTSPSNSAAYHSLRYSQQQIFDHLPRGTYRALACSPAYRQVTIQE